MPIIMIGVGKGVDLNKTQQSNPCNAIVLVVPDSALVLSTANSVLPIYYCQ